MKKDKIRMYKCYSVPLKDWLLYEKKIEFITVALDPNTKKTFFMYVKNEELDSALTEWSNNKPRV